MSKILTVFFDDVREKTIESKTLLESDGFEEIVRRMHTIKGGAGFVKQKGIQNLAEQGMEAAKAKQKEKLHKICDAILARVPD